MIPGFRADRPDRFVGFRGCPGGQEVGVPFQHAPGDVTDLVQRLACAVKGFRAIVAKFPVAVQDGEPQVFGRQVLEKAEAFLD